MAPSLKIIHFIASIDKAGGGTTTYMQLLSNELKTQVDLVVATGYSPHPVEMDGVKVQFFNVSPIRWLLLKKEFTAFLNDEKPDLVHVNGIWNPENALFQKVAQKLGIKVILAPHGMLEPYILARHPLKKKLALWLYQYNAICKADCLHATATMELEQIRKLGYLQQAIIIPNGIDLSHIIPKEWDENRPIQNLLFLSRVHPKKGIEYLIKAIRKVNNKYLHVTIAGEGDAEYIDSLKQLAKQEGVSDQFAFIGGVYGDEKWKLYSQSDLFVLPTFSENFGIVIAEALASNIPVVTTKGTPWSELITRNCGWWVELTVDHLSTAIIDAIDSAPLVLSQMGERGKQMVFDKYEIKAVSNLFVSFYLKILVK